MSETTFYRKAAEMRRGPLAECHGGVGTLDWTVVLEGAEATAGGVNYIHDDVVPPGASIGEHRHEGDAEYYYVLEGRGTMLLDGERVAVAAGDITAVLPGGTHGLENDSAAPMRIVVISVAGKAVAGSR